MKQKAELEIWERISTDAKAPHRTRRVLVETDSITIGTKDTSDVRLSEIAGSFQIEIKWANDKFWLINASRQKGIRVNDRALLFQHELSENDQISALGHQMGFRMVETIQPASPNFTFKPRNNDELWNYLLLEKEFDEILINGPFLVFVDYRGGLFQSPWTFSDASFLEEKIKSFNARPLNGWYTSRPHRHLRVQAALPPLVEAPHLAIRKAKRNVLSMDELRSAHFGTIDEMDFLENAVANRENILIAGGTSTGKTVLMRALVQKIQNEDRLVVIEEEAETDWPHPHSVQIEAGHGKIRETLVETLRMRPTRLIISEVRGAETYDLLQAMNTGHTGSMTTIHANSPREALLRVESLSLSAGMGLSLSSVRRQIAHAINIIVQLERESSGKRKIQSITRVSGIQNDVILMSSPIGAEPTGIKQSR